VNIEELTQNLKDKS